ncbi:2-amino-4-hydroxy-6-hydroxymethyldihydropteridine diphosphokinase [Shewanella zhangzhouensis]|uniref:2-amino-4-hydroxy-6- hydroxymethyldihydropteridine diphosphokinase n=1 Tax=Shewanella zhangzhouensis TaxID=2864213 RepID=UPI001C656CA8|nr:2-amino-4-hydroxy-6-hydroxymethyldihydropteridine diphosphokinase [Shewanella zhangzhouensis]QYK06066.1 2-amino-4-hydroxy-6-hydroxymethyldihydropteridine diphosphokinase [Shewanella zhangzhouensis]
MTQVYVALGANLAEPISQLNRACEALLSLAAPGSFRVSPYYGSRPMGEVAQPDYVNAVACFDTELEPLALLDALQAIELDQGRERSVRWGPRTLDLDLLLYGNQVICSDRLTVPHYGMKDRSFVLIPLECLTPGLLLPCGTPVQSLITQAMRDELHQLTPCD